MCAKVTAIVDGLKDKHAAKINIQSVKVGAGDSKKEIEAAGLTVHGIVAKSATGKIVTTVEGHSYGKDKVEEVIQELLKTNKS